MSIVDGAGARVDPAPCALGAVVLSRTRASAGASRPHAALAAILLLSGLLEFVRLSHRRLRQLFYSAAVKSMLRSWSNFFFSAPTRTADHLDKPPLALWRRLSAKLFGFAPLSLLTRRDLRAARRWRCCIASWRPRFGSLAGLLSASRCGDFRRSLPSRRQRVDPLLILLMLAACGAGCRRSIRGVRTIVWWCVLPVGVQHEVAGGRAVCAGRGATWCALRVARRVDGVAVGVRSTVAVACPGRSWWI